MFKKVKDTDLDHLDDDDWRTPMLLQSLIDTGYNKRVDRLADEWNDLCDELHEDNLKMGKLRAQVKDLYCELFKVKANDEL